MVKDTIYDALQGDNRPASLIDGTVSLVLSGTRAISPLDGVGVQKQVAVLGGKVLHGASVTQAMEEL